MAGFFFAVVMIAKAHIRVRAFNQKWNVPDTLNRLPLLSKLPTR